ncbi:MULTISPECIES: hypothetical protein [unclassified Bacillus cereus group]|uniref:hypothetical protein n=1 Tax=unclassified Bacillus cereus group TaxID=2750818 RepID=UPI0029C130D5|nr:MULTISPECIES: hypothetical protein [unclassified Bacillus cereus group]MDX5829152.1 hypothetical protein [Bacillus cereus group sp. BfR-BA-02147]MDX5941542.1 hypothetical protein [Bacillus cereus group sp. BfR-BA-00415]
MKRMHTKITRFISLSTSILMFSFLLWIPLAIISLIFSLETLQVIVSIGHILHMLLLWIFLALNSRFVYNIPFRRTSYVFAMPRVNELIRSKQGFYAHPPKQGNKTENTNSQAIDVTKR